MFTLRRLWVAAIAVGTTASAQPFTDVSISSGFSAEFLANIPAGGIAVADFDRNGWPDIFVSGFYRANRLFYNQGDGTFIQNATINAQLASSECSVTLAADFNNDGWPDLYVGCRNRSNKLFRNQSGTGFVDIMVPAIDHAPVAATSQRTDAVAAGDLDGNGLLDLYIGVYPITDAPDLDDRDNLDRIVLQTADHQWQDITLNYSLADRERLGRTALAAVISDLDGDGRPDLYVVNDKLQGNTLWHNGGPGCGGWCLADRADVTGTRIPSYGMGVAVADIDRDGDFDIYTSSIDEQYFLRGVSRIPLLFQHEAASPLNHYGVGWGTIFADFDLDGWQDAYLAVGAGGFSTTPNQDQLYRNQDGQFANITVTSGALVNTRPTQAAARIDYDGDGDLDLILGHWNEGYRLYRNDQVSGRRWLGLRLRGAGAVNRDAIGSLATVTTADGAQIAELRAGESRGSSHEPMLHFGLGGATVANVSVRWPDGAVSHLGILPLDSYHNIDHPQAALFVVGFEGAP